MNNSYFRTYYSRIIFSRQSTISWLFLATRFVGYFLLVLLCNDNSGNIDATPYMYFRIIYRGHDNNISNSQFRTSELFTAFNLSFIHASKLDRALNKNYLFLFKFCFSAILHMYLISFSVADKYGKCKGFFLLGTAWFDVSSLYVLIYLDMIFSFFQLSLKYLLGLSSAKQIIIKAYIFSFKNLLFFH